MKRSKLLISTILFVLAGLAFQVAQAGDKSRWKHNGKGYVDTYNIKNIDNRKYINNKTIKAHSDSTAKANSSAQAKATGGNSSASGGSATANGGTGGNASNSMQNHTNIEASDYPDFVSSAAPVVGANCTVAGSISTEGFGGAAAFDNAACEAFMVANWHYEKYLVTRADARVETDKAFAMKQRFHESLYKGKPAGPDAKDQIVRQAMSADSIYEVAQYHLDQSRKFENKGMSIVKRQIVSGEIGGHLVRLIPLLGVVKATD